MTDLALLSRWYDANDAEAFHELVRRHANMVYATGLRVLGDPHAAEDVAQECFEMLCRRDKRPRTNLPAWLHRMATNRAKDRIKTQQRRNDREQRYADEQETSIEPAWDDVRELVDEVLAELPDKLREPLVAHFLEGQTHAEIAEDLKMTRRNVSYRIEKGIDAIREGLKKKGVAVSATALTAWLHEHAAEAVAPSTLVAALGKLAMAGVKHGAVVGGGGLVAKLLASVWGKWTAGIVGAAAVVALVTLMLVRGSTSMPQEQRQPVVTTKAITRSVDGPAAATVPVSEAVSAPVESDALPAEPQPLATEEQPEGCIIRGFVYDKETQEPAGGMYAYVNHKQWYSGTPYQHSLVAQDGTFEVAVDRLGEYRVELTTRPPSEASQSIRLPWERDDYIRQGASFTVDALPSEQHVEIPLVPALAIKGRVADVYGRPIGDVNVSYFCRDSVGLSSALSDYVSYSLFYRTGADGEFRLLYTPAVFSATVHTNFTMPHKNGENYLKQLPLEPLDLTKGPPQNLLITLVPVAEASGRVETFYGKPAGRVKLRLVLLRLEHEEAAPLLGLSDEKGGYRGFLTESEGTFGRLILPGGTYYVMAAPFASKSIEDFVYLETIVLKSKETRDDIVFRLPQDFDPGPEAQPFRVTGVVTGPEGEPLERISIHGAWGSEWTDEQGRFTIDLDRSFPLGPGPHGLRFLGRNGYLDKVIPEVHAGQHLNVVLERRTTPPFAIRVVDASTGQPVERFSANARPKLNDSPVRNGIRVKHPLPLAQSETFYQSYPDGRYVLKDLDRGDGQVEVTAPNYVSKRVPFDLDDLPEELEIRLDQGAKLVGKVEDEFGSPVGLARVYVERSFGRSRISSHGENPFGPMPPQCASDKQGKFVYSGLDAGEYSVGVHRPPWPPVLETVSVRDNATTAEVVIVMPSSGTLAVRLLHDGEPVARTGISAGWGEERYPGFDLRRQLGRHGNTDVDGVVVFDSVPIDGATISYRVRNSQEDLEEVDFRAHLLPSEEGEIVDVDIPVGVTTVTLTTAFVSEPEVQIFTCILTVPLATGELRYSAGSLDGTFTMTEIPPGDGTLRVYRMSQEGVEIVHEQTVTIPADGHVELTLD